MGDPRRSRRPSHPPLVEALDARLLLKTIYVDAARPPGGSGFSWQLAMQSLQDAIGIALPGDQIRVADGVYKPTAGTDRAASFQLRQGVDILGGYAGFGAPDPNARDVSLYPTILSGEIGSTNPTTFDNSLHVVTAENVNATAVLDGFTITAGQAVNGGGANNDRGGGILLRNAGPTISNCTISNNRAQYQGEGMYVTSFSPGTASNPVITGCRFLNNGTQSGNSSGGAIYIELSSMTLTNTVFEGNGSYIGAGALHTVRSNVTVTGCTFTNNWARYGGAAMSLDNGTFATIDNSTFTGNTTQLAGTVVNRGSSMFPTNSRFTNCTFTGNTADRGGAVLNDIGATLTADHCTFLRNTVTTAGGAVWAWQGKVGLTNSRFHGNAVVPPFGGQAEGGAVYTLNTTPAQRAFIVNCEFVGNRGGYGGAIDDLGQAGSEVRNCTFVANAATHTGGAIMANTASASNATRVANSIVWNNTAPKAPQIGNSPTVEFSDVQGSFAGAGNIDADPVFVRNPSPGADGNWGTSDDDYGDLRVQIQSPVIDAGSNAAMAVNYPIDIIGAPRPFDFPGAHDPGAIVDMGAYELNMRLGLLRVPAAQTLALPAGRNTFIVEQLSVGSGATLDIGENALAIEYAGPGDSPAADIEALVRTGYNVTGDWLGTGITSSAAAADHGYHVGVADNASLATPFGAANGGPLFAGVDVDLTTVLVRFTHRVDLNLDGVVDPNDASLFGTNYSENDGAFWAIGDLDMDGLFTPNDASIFGTFYDESLPPM
jgi:hypothetical protein